MVSHSLTVLGALFVLGVNGVGMACSPQAVGPERPANWQNQSPPGSVTSFRN